MRTSATPTIAPDELAHRLLGCGERSHPLLHMMLDRFDDDDRVVDHDPDRQDQAEKRQRIETES